MMEKDAAQNDTFYDIHMHAFNLSHPSFNAFIKRIKISAFPLLIGVLLSPLLMLLLPFLLFLPALPRVISYFTDRLLSKVRNLLCVMESDIGSFFLIIENCLRESSNPILKSDGLHIGDMTYQKIVLTPLMMDFGLKSRRIDKTIHYQPSEKPIVSQVVDVFNAIRKYRNSIYTVRLAGKFPNLVVGTGRIMEIYPFLGLNTANYDKNDLEVMLEKYFRNYQRTREAFLEKLGRFDGDIENMDSNFFAGIKLYPPLGFDPWPENDKAFLKVDFLYRYCDSKRIPITCHGSTGGFVTVSPRQKKRFTDLSKWKKVMEKYKTLKLNLAHFPANGKRLGFLPPAEKNRLNDMLFLVQKYDNVYVDFSNRATGDKYYRCLKDVIENQPDDAKRKKLNERILFGTDFCVNLFSIESYNRYVQEFINTEHLDARQKRLFCSVNPQRFLFD
jgi:hypothetical protein